MMKTRSVLSIAAFSLVLVMPYRGAFGSSNVQCDQLPESVEINTDSEAAQLAEEAADALDRARKLVAGRRLDEAQEPYKECVRKYQKAQDMQIARKQVRKPGWDFQLADCQSGVGDIYGARGTLEEGMTAPQLSRATCAAMESKLEYFRLAIARAEDLKPWVFKATVSAAYFQGTYRSATLSGATLVRTDASPSLTGKLCEGKNCVYASPTPLDYRLWGVVTDLAIARMLGSTMFAEASLSGAFAGMQNEWATDVSISVGLGGTFLDQHLDVSLRGSFLATFGNLIVKDAKDMVFVVQPDTTGVRPVSRADLSLQQLAGGAMLDLKVYLHSHFGLTGSLGVYSILPQADEALLRAQLGIVVPVRF